MKIVKLSIERLYGHLNYDDVVFNSDVTFIYGLNGCGKTTILNITEAIITGQIYKLFDYDFSNIRLEYAMQKKMERVQEITISHPEKSKLIVQFRGQKYVMDSNAKSINETRNPDRSTMEKARIYFELYPFLGQIKDIFNYVYLPLNRSSVVLDIDNEDEYFMMRHMRPRRFVVDDPFQEPVKKDMPMIRVESLIFESWNRINTSLNNISDQFRNNILKSLLVVNEQYKNSDDLITQHMIQRRDVPMIKQTKNAYIKILKEFSLLTQIEENHYTLFFDNLIDNLRTPEDKNIFVDLLKTNEILRLQKLIQLAEVAENQKAIERKPLEMFLKTMNEFINTSEEEKEIKIDPLGRVYFTTKYNRDPISIQFLSSGEKQLMTFFANLIFKVKSDKSGIFVVDEPELSLHLSWQKAFVQKTLELNRNIQLIFATHAPEIIGSKRDKMFRLEKKYID